MPSPGSRWTRASVAVVASLIGVAALVAGWRWFRSLEPRAHTAVLFGLLALPIVTFGLMVLRDRVELQWVGRRPGELRGSVMQREGTNDYTASGTTVVAILDRERREVVPVWSEEWTEVAPGIETSSFALGWRLRVHAGACPVRVQVRNVAEYVSWTDWQHNVSESTPYWVRFTALPTFRRARS